jgi:hypothetical protein
MQNWRCSTWNIASFAFTTTKAVILNEVKNPRIRFPSDGSLAADGIEMRGFFGCASA